MEFKLKIDNRSKSGIIAKANDLEVLNETNNIIFLNLNLIINILSIPHYWSLSFESYEHHLLNNI